MRRHHHTQTEQTESIYYAYYPLTSDFRDYSGNGRDAAPYGYEEFSDGLVCPSGVVGGCLTPINLSGKANFSIELMVYKYTSDSSYPTILDHRHAGQFKGFVCHKISTWSFGASNQSPEGTAIELSNNDFPRNTWLNFTFKIEDFNKQTVVITNNGIDVLNQQIIQPYSLTLSTTSVLALGSCMDWATSRGLSGRIKEAKIKVW